MPTISGLRRRGFTPEAIRDFCDRIGVAKRENVIDVALLDDVVVADDEHESLCASCRLTSVRPHDDDAEALAAAEASLGLPITREQVDAMHAACDDIDFAYPTQRFYDNRAEGKQAIADA